MPGLLASDIADYTSPAKIISQKELDFLRPSFITSPGEDFDVHSLHKFIRNDAGLDDKRKSSIFTMLNTPEIFDHLVAGAIGTVLTTTVARYANLSPTAQTLLGLAGFGMGNIIYNVLQPNKFTTWDPDTARSTMHL